MERVGTTKPTFAVGYQWVDFAVLRKAPWNYKEDDKKTAAKLTASIKKNGQIINLITREMPDHTLEIANGNHRHDSLATLKAEKGFIYNLGANVPTAAAQLIGIETNETNFKTDGTKLGGMFEGIRLAMGVDLEKLSSTTGFDPDEIKGLIDFSKFDWGTLSAAHKANAKGANLKQFMVSFTKDDPEKVFAALTRLKSKFKTMEVSKR